jgi:hypothetical protein
MRLFRSPAERWQIFAEAALVDIGDAVIAVRYRRALPTTGWPLIAGGATMMAVVDAALAYKSRATR